MTNLEYGQLGIGKSDDAYVPVMIKHQSEVVIAVSAGGDHSLIATKSGQVLATGRNDKGQLGTGNSRSNTTFTALKDMEHIKVIDVEAGYQHSA